MGIRYVFTGEVIESGGKVLGTFIKAASWGPIQKLLDATGILTAQRVHESEEDCVKTVDAILRGHAIHGDAKDLEGYRDAWRQIRSVKARLGLSFDTDLIG